MKKSQRSSTEETPVIEVLEIAMIGHYPLVEAADDVGQRDYGRKIVSEVVFRERTPSSALRILRGGRE